MQSQTFLAQDTLPIRLSRAREAEHLGDYDRAARLLADEWPGVGASPDTSGLDDATANELVLRAGALTGYLGSAAQAPGAQERALDLLTESHTGFSRLRLQSRVAEVRIELATCYRRKGAFDAARAMLDSAGELLDGDEDPYLRALLELRRVVTELSAGEMGAALSFLAAAGEAVLASGSLTLRARYHNESGAAMFFLGRLAEALREFDAGAALFALAGHIRYCARAKNNAALTLAKLGRPRAAAARLSEARRLALCVDDQQVLTGIADTEAQILAEQNRLEEAEAVSRARLEEIEGTEEGAVHAENLTTHAVILARLGRTREAEDRFERAAEVAESVGDLHGARRAAELRAAEMPSGNVLQFRKPAERAALTFEWRMADDSLCDIGIRKGDAVRFSVAERGRDGDIVAVLTHDGRFVKIVYAERGNVVRLEGAHPRCPVRRFVREDVSILGVARPLPD